MVVRIQLTIKHIRGHSFTIETDVDSEVVGLKVQIWESQKIPIENQRLVFSGKELADNVILSQMGIGDNATIFLVESMSDIPQQPQAEIPQVTIEAPTQAAQTSDPNMIQQSCIVTGQQPCVVTGQQPCVVTGQQPCVIPVNYYQPLEVETALSEERMQSVIDLAYWARLFCLMEIILSFLMCFVVLYSLIPLVMNLCGYFGTRRINRCLLAFPTIWCFFVGFGLTLLMTYWLFGYGFYGVFFLYFLLGVFHLILFSCFCKLMSRIGRLNCQEWCQTRMRIRAKGCCF